MVAGAAVSRRGQGRQHDGEGVRTAGGGEGWLRGARLSSGVVGASAGWGGEATGGGVVAARDKLIQG